MHSFESEVKDFLCEVLAPPGEAYFDYLYGKAACFPLVYVLAFARSLCLPVTEGVTAERGTDTGEKSCLSGREHSVEIILECCSLCYSKQIDLVFKWLLC